MSPNIGGRINGGPRRLNQLCPPRSPAEAQGSVEETSGAGVQNLLGLDGHWVSALGKLGKDSGRRNSKKLWISCCVTSGTFLPSLRLPVHCSPPWHIKEFICPASPSSPCLGNIV